MKATQKQVAEKIGVSQSTVSRRLANNDAKVLLEKVVIQVKNNTHKDSENGTK